MSARRVYRAGESNRKDYCRACKTDRLHTVIVVGEGGIPLRVSCGIPRKPAQLSGRTEGRGADGFGLAAFRARAFPPGAFLRRRAAASGSDPTRPASHRQRTRKDGLTCGTFKHEH